MQNIKIYNMKKQEVGEMQLSDLFSVEYNEPLIHQAVVTQLANKRQGTKSTLTRSEVRGGGKKPWRQKGTGNARQGSTRAPQWTHGGVVFAPKSRDFSKKMNRTAKQMAMFSALSQKLADGELYVIDKFAVENGKTKEMVQFLKDMGFTNKVLMLMGEQNDLVRRASANLSEISTLPVQQINTYDIVNSKVVVFEVSSINAFQSNYIEVEDAE